MSAPTSENQMTARLDHKQIALGETFDGRWAWFMRRWRARRTIRRLQNTTPPVLHRYRDATRGVATMLHEVRRKQRRKVRGLRWQIVGSVIWAVLRRFGMIILFLVIIGAVGLAIWLYLDDITAFLTQPRAVTPPQPPTITIQNPQPGGN